jgi:hypothetical protein
MKLHCFVNNRCDGVWQDVFSKDYAHILVYWLSATRPHVMPENPQPLTVYVVGTPMPGPGNPDFLMLVVAAAEAETGRTPPVEIVSPEVGDDAYEVCCHALVDWLCSVGCIRDVTISADSDNSKELEVAKRLSREARGRP